MRLKNEEGANMLWVALTGYVCGVLFHVKVHHEHGVPNLALNGRSYPIAFNTDDFQPYAEDY